MSPKIAVYTAGVHDYITGSNVYFLVAIRLYYIMHANTWHIYVLYFTISGKI